MNKYWHKTYFRELCQHHQLHAPIGVILQIIYKIEINTIDLKITFKQNWVAMFLIPFKIKKYRQLIKILVYMSKKSNILKNNAKTIKTRLFNYNKIKTW